MNRRELERAWPAAEPSPGFADRVLDRVERGTAAEPDGSRESARPRASVWRWRPARPLRWLALPAVALALAVGGVVVLESTRPALGGDVIAEEPRVVAIGERAVAELSSGAHIRWSGNIQQDGLQHDGLQHDGLQQKVQQELGEVTYRVEPGAPFEVQTPYGSVKVLGTVFHVSVADPNHPTEGEPLTKRWAAMAGVGVTLGALLFVSVDRGSVRLSTAERALEVGAGKAASVTSDGVPRLEPMAEGPAAPDPVAERQRARRVADAVRRHAARRREAAAQAAKNAPDPALASEQRATEPAPPPPVVFRPHPDAPSSDPATPEEARRREYIKRTVREQYFPAARDCYAELLEREPQAAGRVTLEFAIVGDADAGVVDRVALRDDDEDSIEDPEFRLCMTESMYTAVFEPPPPGTGETTVVYPVMLSPE